MRYIVNLPKIMYLTLLISKTVKDKKYFNTNDLNIAANELQPELVRLRKDKEDYKFLDDTNFGGLRGNFSTVLTFKGIVKRGNRFIPFYSLGNSDRLFNAFHKGQIILDSKKMCAHTLHKDLAELLKKEIGNYTIRENQAHIKAFLEKNKDFPLERDSFYFPKIAVLKSKTNKYFLRILFNTFINDNIIEYNMFDYFKGNKIKKKNINALFVIPTYKNSWNKFYAIDSKELIKNTPLFIYYNTKDKIFYDNNDNVYSYYTLDEALLKIPDFDENIEERLEYNWNIVRNSFVDTYTETKTDIKEEEFSIFLKKFLNFKLTFSIYGKTVVDIFNTSSGGPDVILTYAGGTKQKVELEHKWENYIRHKHYTSLAWKDVWLYADDKWDFEKIVHIFKPYLSKYIDCIPKVFLCSNEHTNKKEAYEVNWSTFAYKKIEIHD